MAAATNVGALTVSGIQDVSGFLPLLGTEQCEEHVSSTLERGFFYAAGSPMSIFGSLGIIKTGLVALWASIDKPGWHGPRQLRNAGFASKGLIRKLQYAQDTDDSSYVAEENIQSILRPYSRVKVDLNLCFWPWIRWNLLMSLLTVGLGSIGVTPYIYIIKFDIGPRPFAQSWLYPVLRIYGCMLITVMTQFVLQLRILAVVHHRLRFHFVTACFHETGEPFPPWWNTGTRAEESMARLQRDIRSDVGFPYPNGLPTSAVVNRSFGSFDQDMPEGERGHTYLGKSRHILLSLLLTLCRILLCGIAAAGVGYVGCFGLVQASNSNNAIGPGIWLAVEVVLCIIRLAVWASNPGFDDPPPPIVIKTTKGRIYQVGWMLDSVSTDDLRAIVIDMDETGGGQLVKNYLEGTLGVPSDQIESSGGPYSPKFEQAFKNMAEDKSIRPGSPIVIYISGQASGVDTDGSTRKSQKTLPHLMFSSSQSTGLTGGTSESVQNPAGGSPWGGISSQCDESPEKGLSYVTLLDLIQAISDAKGNNITLILDTYLNGGDKLPATTAEYVVGYSSHVLLAACSVSRNFQFTESLVNQINLQMGDDSIKTLTYRGVMEKLSQNPLHEKTPNTRSVVSGNFQNRLLFNGLLARPPGQTQPEKSVITINTGLEELNSLRLRDSRRMEA